MIKSLNYVKEKLEKHVFLCYNYKNFRNYYKNMNGDLQVKAEQTEFEKMFDKISKARENCQKRIKDVI